MNEKEIVLLIIVIFSVIVILFLLLYWRRQNSKSNKKDYESRNYILKNDYKENRVTSRQPIITSARYFQFLE